MLSKPQSIRLRDVAGDPQAVGLPAEHPPVQCFLAAPIMSPDRVYGWLCLADKVGGSEFSEEDEALAQILAAQVGRIYENRSLYSELKGSVERLEAEMAERQRVQDEVRALNAQLEQRVAERTAELAAANKELEAFSYSVSHDLRAPLRAIIGFSELLKQDAGSVLPPDAGQHLQRMGDSARQMGKLIDDLLDLSRITLQELHRGRVNLSELSQSILAELQRASPDRPVETRVAPDLWVQGDPNLLRIALENLLRNAWKFTQKTPHPQIELGAGEPAADESTEQTTKTFFVRDNGAGFDPRYAAKLFVPFQRLHSTEEFEGTGVGLAIVKRVIARHGGKIRAEGAVGQGATFYFSLPGIYD
jgi:signal transduction histidine kinase